MADDSVVEHVKPGANPSGGAHAEADVVDYESEDWSSHENVSFSTPKCTP